jgi:hypothetical protein
MSNLLELVQNKLSNWDVYNLSEEEKVSYFKNKYGDLLCQYGVAGEVLESIIVEESFYDAFIEALNNLELSQNFTLPNSSVDFDTLNKDFQSYAKSLTNLVRTAPTAYFANANEDLLNQIDAESLFIQIMTTRLRESMSTTNYLLSKGILGKIQQSGLNFTLTESEKRMLALIAALFDSGPSNEQYGLDDQAVLQATAAHEIL